MAASREPLTSSPEPGTVTSAARLEARVARRISDRWWRDVPLFSIYGLLNNGLICVAYGAAKEVVDAFGFPDLNPVVVTCSVVGAIVGPTLLMVPPMNQLGFRTKVGVAISLGVAGTLLMAGSLSFLAAKKEEKSVLGLSVALLSILLMSLQQSLGENIACVRFQRCSKVAFSMWGAGTGLAGIFPPLLYEFTRRFDLPIRFLCMLPFYVIYTVTCCFVYQASRRDAVRSFVQDYVVTTEEVFLDEDIKELQRQRSGGTDDMHHEQLDVGESVEAGRSSADTASQITTAAEGKLGLYAIYIGFVYCSVYGLEYFIFPTCADRATLCLKKAEAETVYNRSFMAYNVGVTVSRSSIALFQIPMLWVLLVLQALNVLGWILEVQLHFLARLHNSGEMVSYVWMVWVGLMGGAAYCNCLRQYHCSPKVPEDKRDRLINIAFSASNTVILASTLLGLLLDNTVWRSEWILSSCPQLSE